MKSFLISKKRRLEAASADHLEQSAQDESESTEMKLVMLESLHPSTDHEALLEALIAAGGSVEAASELLLSDASRSSVSPRKKHISERTLGQQTSLTAAFAPGIKSTPGFAAKKLTKKGQTLHLFSPEDIAAHTPCSIIHNFLPQDVADALLRELLEETPTYKRDNFKMFDRIVQSPHTFCFYVDNWSDQEEQRTQYTYNGGRVTDIRRSLPVMLQVSKTVEATVNEEIQKRIKTHYPGQKKLKYQMAERWTPNTSFVNCYDGGKENVGYHSDQLTYLGPRAVIGSISLGVEREFRVRKVVPRETQYDSRDAAAKKADEARADVEGQIAIHLPHNSLLVMHAEMQEEWKHSISPAQAINPHPIAKNKRLNITYRHYRPSFHPKYTPQCHCKLPCVLRCVQKRDATRGQYMWMCYAGNAPSEDAKNCTFFQWAEFDDDGEPPWASKSRLTKTTDERDRR